MAYQRTQVHQKKKKQVGKNLLPWLKKEESGEKTNHNTKALKIQGFFYLYTKMYMLGNAVLFLLFAGVKGHFLFSCRYCILYMRIINTKGKQPEERKIFPVGKRCVNNPENTLQNANLQNKTGAVNHNTARVRPGHR